MAAALVACGVSTQAAQLWPRCSLHSMLSASPSKSVDVFARHDALSAFFFQDLHSEQLQTRQRPGAETCREGVGKPKEACWKGDCSSLGWLYKLLCIFWCFSSFLIIRWSSARFAFWETPLHFSPIKMVCFLSANKLEEEAYNNLLYIRQLLLCNDIKWWL